MPPVPVKTSSAPVDRRPSQGWPQEAVFWCLLAALTAGWSPPARAETLTLADCLREVVEHNPEIIQQRLAIERATATRLVLRSRALPSLTFAGIVGELNQEQNIAPIKVKHADGTPVKNPNGTNKIIPGSVQTENQFVVLSTGTLNQPLFDAAIPASFRRGTVGVLAAEQNFYSVAVAQLHVARLLFYRTLYQRENGDVLRQTDETLAGNVKAQNQLVSAGLSGRGPLLSAQVQRTNFAPGISASGGTYRTDLASLLQAMGRELPYQKDGDDPLARITLSGELEEESPTFDPAEAARVALERRPDLRALRAMVKAEQEDANIAKAGYYPLIRLYLAGEYVPQNNVRNQPNAIRQSDQVQTTELRPGVSGSWVVIDPGTTRGAVRAQEAQRDTVAIGLHQLEASVPAEIATVRARLADATGRLAALRGNVDAAQSTLNIVQGGLAQGINSQTDFLYAQGDLLTVRTGLLAARLEMSLAHAELDRITGNYLRYVEEAPAANPRRSLTRK